MIRARAIFFLLALIVTCFSAQAQETRKLETEWLAKDLKAVALIPSLLPLNNQTLGNVRSILELKSNSEEGNLGFGGRRIEFDKPNGYTSLQLKLFTLNGEIQDYSISVSADPASWQQIRSYIIDAWKGNGGPGFKESDSGLFYRWSPDPEFAAYKRAVSLELGEIQVAEVPAELKDDYEYLISPRENSIVGNGGCGYGGETLAGKKAIDALMKAHRVDLVENVLRGYNPGGRVYAALALLATEKQVSQLSDGTRAVIEKIRQLDIKIETCLGCIITHRTAKAIFESPNSL